MTDKDHREDADRRAGESDRAIALHEYERFVAKLPQQPGPDRPDPVRVLRVHFRGTPPGVHRYYLARWSLIARLRRDAERSGSGDTLEDLGPDALMLAQAAQRGDFGIGELLLIGTARDGLWTEWYPPAPVEPVPESRRQRAQRN